MEINQRIKCNSYRKVFHAPGEREVPKRVEKRYSRDQQKYLQFRRSPILDAGSSR